MPINISSYEEEKQIDAMHYLI